MPKSTKHNISPYYITTNALPSFGAEDDNVKRMIKAFETTSLPSTSPHVERWMRKNATHCIVWIAYEIDCLKAHVDKQELWYEEEEQLLSTSTKSKAMMMKKPQEHLPMKMKLQTKTFLRVKT